MKYLYLTLAFYWLISAIALFFGYKPGFQTIVAAFFVTTIFFANAFLEKLIG